MTIIKKEINGNEYTFINSFRGNRSGFVHETELQRNGFVLGGAKIQYYNRTWECYTYQSVMKKIVNELVGICEKAFETAWRNDHNVKRLTKAKKDEMWEDFMKNTPKNYVELLELYEML